MSRMSVLTSAPIHLTYAGGLYDRTIALATGEVRPEGIELNYIPVAPPEAFWRQLQFGEFDVSELSCANYFTLLSRGDRRFVGIPVFPSRTFRHSAVYVNSTKGIARPEDLKGKRVGCAEYYMTMAIWVRAFLQHDYGVMPGDMRWVLGGVEQAGRRERIPAKPPAGLQVEQAPPDRSLSDLLLAGEIDALLSPHLPRIFREGDPRIARLFPKFWDQEREYFEKHRVFPIMHTVCFKREVYERHPWAAVSLYKAFCEAKALALERLYDLPIVGDVRGAGYFWGIELVKDKATRESFDEEDAERLLRGYLSPALFEAGLVCRADDRGDPVIQLAPPLICDSQQFDEIEQILRHVLSEAWERV